MPEWTVRFSREAEKQYKKLKQNGSRPSVNDAIDLLALELQEVGPKLPDWPNFGSLGALLR
jgi:mRNA-degrading endonuclease RelE of RelBE toxin-antitoxin system